MSPSLGRPPRAPWAGGAATLLAAALLAAPVLVFLGPRRWPLFVGAFALGLLALGALERLWQARALPRAYRPVQKGRFRVVDGGKGKGNGHADDGPDGRGGEPPPPDPDDKPRWVM